MNNKREYDDVINGMSQTVSNLQNENQRLITDIRNLREQK